MSPSTVSVADLVVAQWHLGLEVPTLKGQPCAHMQVANETRAWKTGELLFFDDSFVHEVTIGMLVGK